MFNKLLFYDNKKKVILDIAIALIVNIILCTVVLNVYNCIFGINDDMIMRNIAAGGISGMPNAHLVYTKYAMGALISGFYTLSPTMPWYSIIMYVCMFSSLTCILYKSLNLAKNYKMLIINTICYIFLIGIIFRYLIYPQFTTVALMLGCASLFCFFTQNINFKKSDLILTFIFGFLCFCVRYEVFLMAGAFMLLFYIAKFIKCKKKYLKQGLIYAVVFIVALGAVLIGENAAYSSRYYKEYMEFDEARSYVYDFAELPPYEHDAGFYEGINISYPTYLCLQTYTLEVGDDISAKNLNQIYKESKTLSILTFEESFKSGVKSLRDMFVISRHIILCLIIALVFMIVALSLEKRKRFFLIGCFIVAAAMSIVLVVADRVLERVTICIITLFFTAIYAIIAKHENYVFKYLSKKQITLFMTVCFVGSAILLSGLIKVNSSVLKADKSYLENRAIIGDTIRSYVKSGKDNFYFTDTYTLSNMSDTIKSGNNNEFLNMSFSGGWLSRSPMLYEGLDKFNMDYDVAYSLVNNKNAYYIADKDSANAMEQFILENYPGHTMKETDSIILHDSLKNLIYESKVYSFN